MTMSRRGFVQRTGAAAVGGLVSTLSPDLANAARPASAALKSDCHKQDFVNWSQTVKFTPTRYCEPTTEQRVIDIVKEASASQPKTHVRAVGARHSFSQLVATPDTLMSLEKLKTPAPTFNGYRATVPAGMSLKDVIQTLKQHNPSLGLKNLGSIKAQSIAGAIATGTHGTGVKLGSLSTQVVGVCLIDGQGNARTYTDASPGDYLSAARVSLGALGVVTEVTLECVRCYRLEFTAYLTSFDYMLQNLDSLVQKNARVTFWWFLEPGFLRHRVVVMTKNPLAADPPCGAQTVVLDDPYKLYDSLANPDDLGPFFTRLQPAAQKSSDQNMHKFFHFEADYDKVLTWWPPLWETKYHRECEYAIPADPEDPADPKPTFKAAVAVLKAFKRVVDESDLCFLPVEVRFMAKDNVLLSPAYERNVCYIGASSATCCVPIIHKDNYPEIFTRFEPIMREHGGVPHWGKIFSLTRDDVKALYPGTYKKFTDVRDELDPDRVFSNSMLDELFP
jgi:FAD/FMN-containing dehydrogenase